MRSFLTRRRFLVGGSAAVLLASSQPGWTQERQAPVRPATLLGRWQTGNRHLVPPGQVPGGMILAGESAVEHWSTGSGQAGLLWSQPLSDETPATFRPRIEGKHVLVSGRGQLSVFDLADGRLLWRQKPKGEEFSVPLLANGRVVVGDAATLRCLDAENGNQIWSYDFDFSAGIHYGPAALNGVVYLCPGDGKLYAFDAANGQKLWAVDRSEQWQYLRQLHFWNDVLVAGGYHDEIWGLDAKDGRFRWRFSAGNFVNSHMVSGKGVYFWSPTGWIYKLNPADGLVKWRHRTVDYVTKRDWNWAPLMAELTAGGGRLFCLDMGHVLHVLDQDSGDETHRLALPKVRAFLVPDEDGKTVWAGGISGDLLKIAIG